MQRYIARFLDDDEDVPIRFVCKQTHDNLSDVQSSMTLVLKSEDEERDMNAMEKARPYVTSVSMLQWARETLVMPWDTNVCYASIIGGNLDVVTWLRSHEREVSLGIFEYVSMPHRMVIWMCCSGPEHKVLQSRRR